MTNNDELALKSEERIKAIANGAQMLMGESRQLAAAALYWKEQARIATDAFQQSGIMQVKAEDKIEVLLAERDADKKRIAELEESHKKLRETMAAIHNTIRADGAYTTLAAIMSGAKRAYEESAAIAGIKLEVGE
ncbi:hypothetical protein [Kosakonia cowanii]|uniref:hypothetical protein n=1 Tax=Kosakonia cowanii TaxID=208223 RepID=UPI001E562425|nr:hypothetical protein [Kosakonia cowanii]